ncbi:2733_t:CDS:2, partial [Acaulospora morrowiae]
MAEANFLEKVDIVNTDQNLGDEEEDKPSFQSQEKLPEAPIEILSDIEIAPDNKTRLQSFENVVPDNNETRNQENLDINRDVGTDSTYNNAETILRDIEKGVITVREGNDQETLDSELVKLEKIPKFEPLIKVHPETNFTLGGLWAYNLTSQEYDKEPSFGYESLYNFSSIYQSHMQRCAEEICEDQRIVMETVKSVDEYCARISQTMIATQLQAKNDQEQISVVSGLMKQAEKTRKLTYEIFQTLNNMDMILPEEERLVNRLASNKWTSLCKFRLSMKQNQHYGPLTKRLSRINPSHLKVSLDTVLSEKHQYTDATSNFNVSPDRTTLSSIQSFDNNVSNRLKEIVSNKSHNAEERTSTQWFPLPLGSVPIFKRVVNNTNVENTVSSSEIADNAGLITSTSDTPAPVNKKLQSSVSLLSAMLKKSSVQWESGPSHKNSSKDGKKKSTKSESGSNRDEPLNSNDRVRLVERRNVVKHAEEGASDSDEE